ncbi:hypothetical protein B0T21DRAFT_9932 [Apiosordaria backusii]|uniref:Uncharacterized protein n=1 Tax=Apiosordaria backusii TaxID=314023 RepID=A0AA40K6G0_9PEZI|nr:hypothetical protein B0T21DRAFT_9932 [Apiosordaria backusii]
MQEKGVIGENLKNFGRPLSALPASLVVVYVDIACLYARGHTHAETGFGSGVWGSERQSRSLSRTCHFSPQQKGPWMRIIQIDRICRKSIAASPSHALRAVRVGFHCSITAAHRLPGAARYAEANGFFSTSPHHPAAPQQHDARASPSHLPSRGRYDVSGPLYTHPSQRHYAQGRTNAADAGG